MRFARSARIILFMNFVPLAIFVSNESAAKLAPNPDHGSDQAIALLLVLRGGDGLGVEGAQMGCGPSDDEGDQLGIGRAEVRVVGQAT